MAMSGNEKQIQHPLSDEALMDYLSDDSPLWVDTLHHHFERLKLPDWIKVGNEGARLIGLMFFQLASVENESPISDIATVIAGAAEEAALRAVAAAIGIGVGPLRSVLEPWTDPAGDDVPASLGPEAFGAALAEEAKAWHAEGKEQAPIGRDGGLGPGR